MNKKFCDACEVEIKHQVFYLIERIEPTEENEAPYRMENHVEVCANCFKPKYYDDHTAFLDIDRVYKKRWPKTPQI